MLHIRQMVRSDIQFAVRLAQLEGWDTPSTDFERILKLDPHGSLTAVFNGKRVGMATTTSYGNRLAWIGNVIVEKEYRGREIGGAIVTHCIEHLKRNGVRDIGLYCFNEQINFYLRLGFVSEATFLRLSRPQEPSK